MIRVEEMNNVGDFQELDSPLQNFSIIKQKKKLTRDSYTVCLVGFLMSSSTIRLSP